jgi:GNAT superfamily N-acetyltransferase
MDLKKKIAAALSASTAPGVAVPARPLPGTSMTAALYVNAPPPEEVLDQVLDLVVAYMSDLSMLAVPPSNLLYPFYEWALPREVGLYIMRIGQMPSAPVELVVAFADDDPSRVVGFLLYLPVPTVPDACGVTYMAVKQSYRGKGVGSAMMREAISRYPHVELTCPIKKVPFYERLGFRVLDAHNTQIVMNTREQSTTGMMGIVDVAAVYESAEAQKIKTALLSKWGRKPIGNAEAQLHRHVEQLARKAQAYVRERAQ